MFSYLDKLLDGIFGYQKPDTSQLSTSTPPTITTVPLKQEYFVTIGESETQDLGLLPVVSKRHNQSVPLEEIPFEDTRIELIELYIALLKQCVLDEKLKSIPAQYLISHYLFLKTLAANERNKGRKDLYLNLSQKVADYLEKNESKIWSMAVECTKTSEYPIVSWIKNHQIHFNFIRAFILDNNKKPLTHNQRAFMQQFRDSTAFFFPNQVYLAWLTQSYESDSILNPMYRESRSTHYYHASITDNLLLRTRPKQVNFGSQHFFQKGKGSVKNTFRFNINDGKLLRIQGRTLLFSMNKGHEIIAVKVQKKGESQSALSSEFQMADYLLKHQRRLNLQSQLPIPLSQYSISRAEILEKCWKSPGFEKFENLISDAKNLEIYVYKATPSYFTYLHDKQQSLGQFTSSVQKNVHDLFVLLREGIVFPYLADMFHTHIDKGKRNDKGRYQALVELLSALQSQMGRLDKWQKAVEFVNLRVSGIADLGDNLPLTSFLTVSDWTKYFHEELLTGAYHPSFLFLDKSSGSVRSLFNSRRKVFGNYLYLNIIAEYLLVIQLAIGSYGDKVTRKMDTKSKIKVWEHLAELMFSSCAEAVNLITGIPKSRALTFIKQRANLRKHTQQTSFWMTPDYSNMDSLSIQSQQSIMYPGESDYEINSDLVPGLGLSLDGINQDLGDYNQASPLRELEKLLYATVTLIEGTQQLDKQFFQQLDETEKMIASAAEADKCYQAVAKLLELARPGCQMQRRLALSYYDTIKRIYPYSNPYDLRFELVAKEEAIIKIQRFWREHKKENQSIEKGFDFARNTSSSLSPL
ncbi:TPA: SidJ family T4SS effector polyglutamylation protein [Legionella pneumophila]